MRYGFVKITFYDDLKDVYLKLQKNIMKKLKKIKEILLYKRQLILE